MPFSANASVISTDLDNMLRGLYRDNADHAVSGTVAETDMAKVTITGGVIGVTGGLRIAAAGSIAGANNTKTIRLYLGATVVATITQGAATVTDWFFEAWCFNTSNTTQRWMILKTVNDLVTVNFVRTTSAIDTSGNAVLKLTGQLANVNDTITQTMMDVFVVQIN